MQVIQMLLTCEQNEIEITKNINTRVQHTQYNTYIHKYMENHHDR